MFMALLATAVDADEVQVDGLTYAPATVRGVAEGVITFDFGRRRLAKPLADVTQIVLAGQADFNRAEELLAQGQPAEAAAIYARLADRSQRPPVEQLLPWRRMRAEAQAGRIDEAVALWLELLRASEGAAGVAAAGPSEWDQAPEEARARAIDLVQTAREDFADAEHAAPAVRDMLVALYRAQGQTAEALELAAEAAATAPAAEAGAPAANTQLQLAQLRLEAEQPAEALSIIQEHLHEFRLNELPEALLIRGRARLALAEGAAQDAQTARSRRIEAGLDFVRIASHFPRSGPAPEALLLAGRISRALGDDRGAAGAWRRVIERYERTPWAQQARERLQELPEALR
jgi:TolA-binding protein